MYFLNVEVLYRDKIKIGKQLNKELAVKFVFYSKLEEFMHFPLVLALSIILASVTCLRRQSLSNVPVTLILNTGGGPLRAPSQRLCREHWIHISS